MSTFERMLDWLATLPPGALLGAMSALAAIENIFPPIPADVLVAFGGFLAARSGQSPWPAFMAVWAGNMVGAAMMYGLGRKYGSARVERRYHLARGGASDARVLAWHQKYGTAAFFVSRFVPGVRSVVPPVAGALRIPFPGAMLAIALASGVWYGAITLLAFRAGSNWELLRQRVAQFGQGSAVVGGLIIAGIAFWWLRRRRSRDSAAAA